MKEGREGGLREGRKVEVIGILDTKPMLYVYLGQRLKLDSLGSEWRSPRRCLAIFSISLVLHAL
jgi:hypothetical protein